MQGIGSIKQKFDLNRILDKPKNNDELKTLESVAQEFESLFIKKSEFCKTV